MLQKYKI